MRLIQHGCAESFKGAWHFGGLIFAGGAALYNMAALIERRESHLAINASIYTLLTIFEASKVRHHFEDC